VDVVLLTPRPDAVDFRLQTPNGLLIEPWRAQAEPAMRYVTGDGVAYYRITLPVQLRPNRFDQAGTWHALLTIGQPHTGRTPDDSDGNDLSILRGRAYPAVLADRPARRPFEFERAFAVAQEPAAGEQPGRRGLPYSLVVHSYSNVSLRATADQRSFEPGATVTVNASLTQSGVPVSGDPYVWADVTRPDGSLVTLVLDPFADGEFEASFRTTAPGVYRIRVRARGRTRIGRPFTRERTLTAAVWRGGDNPPPVGGGDSWCEFLSCLLKGGVIDKELIERLRRLGFDLEALHKCLGDC
jgi:hypothetical protein